MDRESYFIDELQRRNITYGLGDDGVKIEGKVYAMDLFCEGVHFLKKSFSYKAIAKKAMLINISDILAMGAIPKYALLGISFNKDMKLRDIKDLLDGFECVAREYNIKIIGGDTIKNSKLNIAITMIGESRGREISRHNFASGDLLCMTGEIGNVAKDMRYSYRGGKIAKSSKFLLPRLNASFIYEARKFIKGGMDISDGLFYELNRIAALKHIKFSFLNGVSGVEKLPLERKAKRFSTLDRMRAKSGEEYELLFSIKTRDYLRLKRVARKNRLRVKILARILRGKERYYLRGHHN